jgi:cell division protein FtsB
MGVLSARQFWLPVMLATLVAAFFGAVLGRRGALLERMRADQALLERRLARVSAECERLRAERDELLGSAEAVERVAREEFGFTAPGETVVDWHGGPAAWGGRGAATGEPTAWLKAFTWPHLPLALPAGVFALSCVAVLILNCATRARDRQGEGADADDTARAP